MAQDFAVGGQTHVLIYTQSSLVEHLRQQARLSESVGSGEWFQSSTDEIGSTDSTRSFRLAEPQHKTSLALLPRST